MNKSVIGLIIAIIVIVVAVAGFTVYRNSNTNTNNTEENIINNVQEEIEPEESIGTDNEEDANVANTENTANNSEEVQNTSKSGSKILVVYYSAQSHTKSVAEKIAKNLKADTFEIVPEEVYSDDDLIGQIVIQEFQENTMTSL